MSQRSKDAADNEDAKTSGRAASFTVLPDDLASDIDRAMAYLRNHQAKQRIRLRLKQYAQEGEYRPGPSASTPPA